MHNNPLEPSRSRLLSTLSTNIIHSIPFHALSRACVSQSFALLLDVPLIFFSSLSSLFFFSLPVLRNLVKMAGRVCHCMRQTISSAKTVLWGFVEGDAKQVSEYSEC